MKIRNRGFVLAVAVAILGGFAAADLFASDPIVYPAKGQSEKKMEKDKSECRTWAEKNAGSAGSVDSSAQPQASGPKGERVKGGARGAAGGAVVGAIAGDAGKGAAIGAAAGGMRGGRKQRQERREEKEEAKQAQQQVQQQAHDNFNRAYSACLEGRGYSVK